MNHREKKTVDEQVEFMRMINHFEQVKLLTEMIFNLKERLSIIEELLTGDGKKKRPPY